MENTQKTQGLNTALPGVRPDIQAIKVVDLTHAGMLMMSAYSPGTIQEVVEKINTILQKRNMSNTARWNALTFGCRDKAKESGIKANYHHAKKLLDEYGFSYDDDPCIDFHKKGSQTELKTIVQRTSELWNDRPSDLFEYAIKSDAYEMNRKPGSFARNPYFTWLKPEWKANMFLTFPYLKEIHEREWMSIKGVTPKKVEEDAPNFDEDLPLYAVVKICKNLETDSVGSDGFITTKQSKRRVAVKDPWWDKLETSEKIKVLNAYPFYEKIVGEQKSLLQKTMETITTRNNKMEK